MYVFVATALYRIIHIVANPFEIIAYYYHYLINHMDADSVSHMMHNDHCRKEILRNYDSMILIN